MKAEVDKRKWDKTHVDHDAVDTDDGGTETETNGHHGVQAVAAVQVARQRPGGGVGVERLDRGAAPGRVAVGVGQQGGVGGDNGHHDDVVDEAAEDGAPDLREEHCARADLDCVRGKGSG